MARTKGAKNKLTDNVKYNEARAAFVIAKLEDGITISEACRLYPAVLPDRQTIDRWQKQHPEFKEAIFKAYHLFFIKKLEELDELSKELLNNNNEELKTELSELSTKDALLAIRARKEGIQVRINTIQFYLRNIAPKFVPELQDQPKEIGLALPNITIVHYNKEPKVIDGEVETKKLGE